MIRINRSSPPEFLQSEMVLAAKEALRKSFENSARQERFKFDFKLLSRVRNELVEMCHDKCAYCESSLSTASMGEVENFRPKGGARGLDGEYAPHHYWWLAYEWDNLLMACQMCSEKFKRDLFPLENENYRAAVGAMGADLLLENAMIIDPAAEDPEQHLSFAENGIVTAKTKKGQCTIEVLGLNREELIKRRKQAADNLRTRLKTILKNNLKEAKNILKDINELLGEHPRQEYVATLRATFDNWLKKNAKQWDAAARTFTGLLNNWVGPARIEKMMSEEPMMSKSERNAVTDKVSVIKRFSIKSVEIENFKSIEKLNVEILPNGTIEGRESWLLLLGDNGIGKSSILQAIALALAGKKQLDALHLDVNDYLKYNTAAGFVRIQSYEHNVPVELYFDTTGFRTELDEPPTFLLAYGSTRLLPKGAIQPNPSPQDFVNVANLFDYSVALCNPHEWLQELPETEFHERVAPAFFDVLALRGEDRLFVENGKINITQFGTSYELEDNSDGYKTVVALVADIMKTLSVDRAGYHNAQGIVLIDEIGNHLHPRWRMKIVPALRRAFPHLQFIVTTHEPLCLRGLSHGEVVVLVRDHEKKIRALDKSLLPDHSMMRIEQLLTSDLFGLINIMDEEAEKTYEEYYNLLAKKEELKTDEDRVKITEMSAMIAEKEVLGTTPDEQVMYKVINETFAKKIRDEGFKTKEELKKETVEEVRTFIKTKKYNWL